MRPRNKKSSDEAGPSVPAYIVTFSDMVTLLLTFFVMLLSMAQVRDEELFNKSRDAFINHINCYGLGMLSGRQMTPQFGSPKIKYNISDPDPDADTRTMDSEEEKLRRLFNKLSQNMETLPSQITCQKMDFTVSNIRFEKGKAELNKDAEDFMTQFVSDLQSQVRSGEVKLYVLGMANDAKPGKDQWILSSRRAQKVADYLRGSLFEDFRCPIYAWGGGPGGHWVGADSTAYKDSHILIAILRGEETAGHF